MDKEYRIPKLEEFVQGFEFELASDCGFCFLEPGHRLTFPEMKRFWNKSKVTWMLPPNEIITRKVGDKTWSAKGSTLNFFKPFNEQSLIDQGLVRVKI